MDAPRPEAHPDLDLVAASLRGESVAIDRLAYRLRCVATFLRAANARLGRPLNEHDLADLAQDVTLIILNKRHEYAGRAPLEAWIASICNLELHNGIRKKRRHASTQYLEPEDLMNLTATATPDPGDEERILQALARLGGVEAETIRIKHFEGLTFEEIGQRLRISPNTAKTRYYRGMLRLKELLATEDHGEEGIA